MTFNGGVTSHANLEKAKANGVKDVCFLKGRGLEEEAMCRSRKVYKSLRKFREGIDIRDILGNTEFWIRQMHMECAQISQELCVDRNCVGEFADNNPQAISLRDR